MCGFVGFIGEFDQGLLEESVESIKHRGPDDSGFFYDSKNSVGLGFSRLAIQDLSQAGHQPMISDDNKVAIVFNGEIYNVNSLREKLQLAGYKFNGTSDTEVLLKMYLHYGLKMLPQLNGMFAISIWNSTNKELILIQDAHGIKPLYYSQSNVGFVFASELKAIMKISGKFKSLNKEALMRYATYLWCPGSSTPASNVYKVNAGELLILSADKIKKKESWHLKSNLFSPELKNYSKNQYIAQVKDGLQKAVSRQLISDVPVGAFLSGGLDSSAIVAFARKENPKLECFTIEQSGGEDKGQTSDLFYAKHVAKHLNVSLNVVTVSPHQLIDNIEKMIWHLDEPLADPAALNVFFISKLARDSGINVLLSGAGGDDLFTGYRRHAALNYSRFFKPIIPKMILKFLSNSISSLDQNNPHIRKISKVLKSSYFDGDDQILDFFKWTNRADLLNLLDKDFLKDINPNNIDKPMIDFLKDISNPNIVERALALDKRFFLSDHNFKYTDKMSMAAGVEVRVPFLDNDLVQIAATIPTHLKQTLFHGKWILKKALEGTLPKEVIYRPKTGFGAPLRRWIGNDLKPMMDEYLSDISIKNRGIFDARMVRKLITDTENGKIDGSYTIFSILCIEIWCKKFLKSKLI